MSGCIVLCNDDGIGALGTAPPVTDVTFARYIPLWSFALCRGPACPERFQGCEGCEGKQILTYCILILEYI